MRHIRKSGEPAEFRAWRDQLRPRGSVPPWDEFAGPARIAVRLLLASDQAKLCCYCTATIAAGNYHIEHFRPRDRFRQLTYRWRNLFASCESWRRGAINGELVETQKHCGDAKENWFDETLTVNPLHPRVGALFRYNLLGKVYPSKNLRTRYGAVQSTIDKLNLNAPSLVARRAALLKRASEDAAKLSRAEWVRRYLSAAPDGSLQEFWPALHYNYDKHWSSGF